ncbi:MAG: hemolysin family protein [Rikenellaceae bacterium]
MVNIIIIVFSMLLLSAFFSGMEIAFVSKNRLKLEIERKQSRAFDYLVEIFSNNPGQYITTILVGNNIALVIYSLFMSLLVREMALHFGWESIAQHGSLFLETTLSTLLIIFIGEFLPKSIFKHNPNFYFRIFAAPIYVFYLVLYPIAKFTTLLSFLLLKLIGRKVDNESADPAFDRADLASLIDATPEVQSETENEIKLFQNALDFADQRVRDCMTQRVDIEAVDIESTTIEEITARFSQTKYSRLFVWRGSIDNIVGYVNSKSLFGEPQELSEIVKSVNCVPESMPLNLLIQTLTKDKRNIAVVIDEFGGTAGVISLEDVLEEIFGEIEDEHDEPEMIERELSDGEYLFAGRLEVKYLNERYDLALTESDDYDTLAGYIIYTHKGIPQLGESVVISHIEFKILRTTHTRIELVKLKMVDEKGRKE